MEIELLLKKLQVARGLGAEPRGRPVRAQRNSHTRYVMGRPGAPQGFGRSGRILPAVFSRGCGKPPPKCLVPETVRILLMMEAAMVHRTKASGVATMGPGPKSKTQAQP